MKKILIIGANSAIATEAARLFALKNKELFLIARNKDKLITLKDDLLVRGASKVDYEVADLNNIEKHNDLIEKANMSDIDVVLIAHGTLGDQKVCEQDFNLAEQEIKTNFLSILSLLTIIANELEKKKRGCIAVISSVAGDRGRQSNYIYGTAKSATTTLLQGLRNRLYPFGINVITVKPGFVDTPMTAKMKKGFLFASPEAVAKGIHRAIDKNKSVVYLPFFWRWIMLIIIHIPEFIFKRLKL